MESAPAIQKLLDELERMPGVGPKSAQRIAYWLLNTDRMVTHTGGGSAPRKLSRKMADALLQFMRTGNPNCRALPRWPRYTPQRGELIILDSKCRAAEDPDRSARNTFND